MYKRQDRTFGKASERGAPLPTASGWHWSITHDRSLVAGAVWRDCPVGVDVEHIALRRRVLVERVAGVEERAILGETTERPLDALGFARLWTSKEAVLKAERIGLPGMNECQVVATDGDRVTHLTYEGAPRTVFHSRRGQHLLSACVLGLQPMRILWSGGERPCTET